MNSISDRDYIAALSVLANTIHDIYGLEPTEVDLLESANRKVEGSESDKARCFSIQCLFTMEDELVSSDRIDSVMSEYLGSIGIDGYEISKFETLGGQLRSLRFKVFTTHPQMVIHSFFDFNKAELSDVLVCKNLTVAKVNEVSLEAIKPEDCI